MDKTLGIKLFLLTILLGSAVNLPAQQSFDRFWTKFKTAVLKNDKNKVADLTRFPLQDESENDEGRNPVFSRSKFLRQFDYFFDRKMKKCFQTPKFYLNNNDPTEKIITCDKGEYTGFSLMFKRYKSGWKWINFNPD